MTTDNRIDWHMTFLSSKAENIHPGQYLWNFPSGFKIKTNEYEIGVIALSVPSAREREPSSYPHLHIKCDFIEAELVGAQMEGVLLSCNIDASADTHVLQQTVAIQNVLYHPITVSHFNNGIKLTFMYSNGKPFEFNPTCEIMATFHVRRIPLAFV